MSTTLCASFALLITLSHGIYLYSGRWHQWAWTNGDSQIKYIFADDEHEVNSFDSSATSIIFHNSGALDREITISSTGTCFPSNLDFNIDEVLQCDGDADKGGWGGIFYKNDTHDWSHLSADFWVKIATATLEPTPLETPAPLAVFLSSNEWHEWAYTNGDSAGVQYNFRYGVNQLYSFNPGADFMSFEGSSSEYGASLNTIHPEDICWPSQNFNIDEVLLCIDVEFGGVNPDGWAGIKYKSGPSGDDGDWSEIVNGYSVFVDMETSDPTPDPTEFPTQFPTYEPTLTPTPEPTEFPTYEPTPNPTPDPTELPTEFPTKEPTLTPTPEPTEFPTYEPTLKPTPEPTEFPTSEPTPNPTPDPTEVPTQFPTYEPTPYPTYDPTQDPTWDPTYIPTVDPTVDPTREPTQIPTRYPTYDPTKDPTTEPTMEPTIEPTTEPTVQPTDEPTQDPTKDPTNVPTPDPTHPTQCFIGDTCEDTMDCCPDHVYPRDFGITCSCRPHWDKTVKFCCLKAGWSGCVEEDDCCGDKHVCVEGRCLNRKQHENHKNTGNWQGKNHHKNHHKSPQKSPHKK